jgi:SAM-dependent methyltransferase
MSGGPDLAQVTARQRSAWSAGDFNRLALSIMEVAEHLVATADPRPGTAVLDVACGTGNAALVAARRFCRVTGVDFAPPVLERARMRAEAEGSGAEFVEGDAQALPFPDASFDTVMSVFGVMFAPDQATAAGELLRVCRPGGRIALANWTPGSVAQALFAATAEFVPPPPVLEPPWRWGTAQGLAELLGDEAEVRSQERTFHQRFLSVDHGLELFRRYFGPTVTAYAALGEDEAAALTAALAEAVSRFDGADDGTCRLEGHYLEVVATRR